MKKEPLELDDLAQHLKQLLASSKDIESAAPALLDAVARWFECQWAAYWQVQQQHLRAIATWSETPALHNRLLRDTQNRALTLNEGAAGQVWRSGQPFCTRDLVGDMCLPRSLDARAAGLSGGIWFPIRTGPTTGGVIELLGKDAGPNDPQFHAQLLRLGRAIGETLPERRNS